MLKSPNIERSASKTNDTITIQLEKLGYSISQINAHVAKKNAEIIVAKLIELHPLLIKSFNREEITLFAIRTGGSENLNAAAALIKSGLVLYHSTRKALNDLFQRNQCHIARGLIAEKIREHLEESGVEETLLEYPFSIDIEDTSPEQEQLIQPGIKSVTSDTFEKSSRFVTGNVMVSAIQQPKTTKRRLVYDAVLDGRRINFRFPERFFTAPTYSDNKQYIPCLQDPEESVQERQSFS